jgi:hypothetical protein
VYLLNAVYHAEHWYLPGHSHPMKEKNNMTTYQIIYQIKLPPRMIAETFVEFMQEEYFPAVHKGPTRVGQVTRLTLLRSGAETDEEINTFFMHVSYSGLAPRDISVDDKEVKLKFETLYAKHVKRLGTYFKVADWPDENRS